MMRDTAANPYSADEQRVAKYIGDLIDMGGGDDPIGFLMSSHQTMVDERREQVSRQREYLDHHPWQKLIPPTCKQDVVDLLFRVQVGEMSCRKAASLLFPEFETVTPNE